jgi:hypothetical protein
MFEKAGVLFRPERVGPKNWQIRCTGPDGRVECVTGFLDEKSIENWLASIHCAHWLNVRGYREPPINAD